MTMRTTPRGAAIPSISDVVARIERLRRSRGQQPALPAMDGQLLQPTGSPALFLWECGPSGEIAWVEGAHEPGWTGLPPTAWNAVFTGATQIQIASMIAYLVAKLARSRASGRRIVGLLATPPLVQVGTRTATGPAGR